MSWIGVYNKRKVREQVYILEMLEKNKRKANKNYKIKEEDKFISFFKHSLLPSYLVNKLDILIENTEEEMETGIFRKFLTPANKRRIKHLMRGFYLILLVIFCMYNNSQNLILSKKQIYTLKTFNYFNKHYFNSYFYKINIFQYFTQAYFLDKNYYNTYVQYFNLFLLYESNYLKVLFNFENYKYEQDKVLRPDWNILENYPKYYKPSEKEKKPERMYTEFFEYMNNWRKNRSRKITKYSLRFIKRINLPWNIIEKGPDNEELIEKKRNLKILKKYLTRHDNLYFFFIIYEFVLKLYDNLLLNYFNYDFFGKVKIFLKNKKIKMDYKNEIKILSSPYLYLSEEDLNNAENSNQKSLSKFNTHAHLINIKYYRIKIPFLIFLLHTTYSIYHRRARYNLYIRGDLFFQEHFSKMQYFLWVNSDISSKITKNKYYPLFYNQRLYTFYSFSNHVELNWFNKWFTFYYCYNLKLKRVLTIQNDYNKSLFNLLSSNSFILNIINKKNFIEYFYDNSYFRTQYLYDLYNGYYLFMENNVTKYDKLFSFAHFSYLEYEPMIRNVYLVPYDKHFLIQHLTKKTALINYLSILIDINYTNFYFLNDLFNFKKDNILSATIKSLNFYHKMFRIIFMLLDPFFFKYFYQKYFAIKRRRKHLRFLFLKCADYIMYALLSISFTYNFNGYNTIALTKKQKARLKNIKTEFNFSKFNFLIYNLYWKIETSNTFVFNFAYSDYILQTNVAINSIYQQRFKDLASQINFLFKKSKILDNFRNKYYYIMDVLKNHYLELLLYNVEYILFFFFINIKKYFRLLLNSKINSHMKFTYSTFIYRYYIYNIWLESRYYDNWFYERKKRVYWIYNKFSKFEGKSFYAQRGDFI